MGRRGDLKLLCQFAIRVKRCVIEDLSFSPGFSPVLRVIVITRNRLNGFWFDLLYGHRAKARCE